ncbi:MAG TPA: DoxX family protein [Ktedonobacteraceae bacterium]
MKLAEMKKQSTPTSVQEVIILKPENESSTMADTGLLIQRLTMGGLLAGHGAQKLFGWFDGPGLKGAAGWLESMGFKPGTPWAMAASASEFGGGTLTALGLLYPLGPLATIGPMVVAIAKAHWGKPIWASQGGAELPVLNLSTALALALTGPGRFSLDRLFRIRLPRTLVAAAAIVEAAMLVLAITRRPEAAETTTGVAEEQPAGTR